MSTVPDDECHDCHELRARLRKSKRRTGVAYFFLFLAMCFAVIYLLGRDRLDGMDILEARDVCEVINGPINGQIGRVTR